MLIAGLCQLATTLFPGPFIRTLVTFHVALAAVVTVNIDMLHDDLVAVHDNFAFRRARRGIDRLVTGLVTGLITRLVT